MKYYFISTLIAWIFPTKKDRSTFRSFCSAIDERRDTEAIWERYPKLIKYLKQEYKNRKLKVIFLCSENSKWCYQSIYEAFNEHPNFDVQVIITVNDNLLKKKYDYLSYQELARQNYRFFEQRGMNVDYAYNLKKKKYRGLKRFNPDIVFYEQPWGLPDKQNIKKVSKYALPLYCSYGSCITNGSNEFSESFFRNVYTYFVDNPSVRTTLLEHDCNDDAIVVSGHPKLDAYLQPIKKSNIIWKSKKKKRVIFAPHHSFYKSSTLGFGTFDWNYKFFYELAKNNPDIEFIFKPHPELKRQIVKQKLMTKNEMIQYFNDWENLPNAQIYEKGNYFDMFRSSDLLITDCNSFLYEYLPTKKPVIHLISKKSVGHNLFGRKIISGYYNAANIDELNKQLELVLFNGEDPLLPNRKKIISKDLVQPKSGVANFILKYIIDILENDNL